MKIIDPKAYFFLLVGGEGTPIPGWSNTDRSAQIAALKPFDQGVLKIGAFQNHERGDLKARIYLWTGSGVEDHAVDVEAEGRWAWIDRALDGPPYVPREFPDPEPTPEPEPEPDPTPNDIAVLVASVQALTDVMHAVDQKLETLNTKGLKVHL